MCAKCKEAKPLDEFRQPKASYCKPCTNRIAMDWQRKYPGRRRAHQLVAWATKSKLIVRPELCQKCGEDRYVLAHHEDYSKPLDVMWLCDQCHALRHFELKRSRPRVKDPLADGRVEFCFGSFQPGTRGTIKKGGKARRSSGYCVFCDRRMPLSEQPPFEGLVMIPHRPKGKKRTPKEQEPTT